MQVPLHNIEPTPPIHMPLPISNSAPKIPVPISPPAPQTNLPNPRNLLQTRPHPLHAILTPLIPNLLHPVPHKTEQAPALNSLKNNPKPLNTLIIML